METSLTPCHCKDAFKAFINEERLDDSNVRIISDMLKSTTFIVVKDFNGKEKVIVKGADKDVTITPTLTRTVRYDATELRAVDFLQIIEQFKKSSMKCNSTTSLLELHSSNV